MSLEGLAALIVAVVTLVSAAFGWVRLWRREMATRGDGLIQVLERMESDKAEVLSHVTANRIQTMRQTNKMISNVYEKMDEGHSTILEMLADLELKVTKPVNSVSVRAGRASVSRDSRDVSSVNE